MRQSRIISLLLTLLIALLLFNSSQDFSILCKRNKEMYHKMVRLNQSLVQVQQDFKNFSYFVVNYYDRKPNFQILAKANVRIKIGKSGGSGTVIGIEEGYTYVLTAKHCTPLGTKENTNNFFFSFKNNTKLEIEIPMKDKDYDSGLGKNYRKGCEYAVIEKENIYAHEKYDIALLRFPIVEGHDLAILFPAKRRCYIGDTVYAVGNPIAMIDNITKGIFSCTKTWKEKDYMVISSGIIMGNSGGAVVNEDGELVGVVVAISQFVAPRPRTMIFVFHLGMCIPQEIMIQFVVEAFEHLTEKTNAD